MRAVVDEDRCRGHGICCTLCPEVFDLSDDGYAAVRLPDIPPEFAQAARAAAMSCPEGAITVS